MALSKLTSDASLAQVATQNKNINTEITSIRNNLVNTIGSPIVATDTLSNINTKLNTLTNTLRTTLTNKGVPEILTTDKLETLISKVNTDTIVNPAVLPVYLYDTGTTNTSLVNSFTSYGGSSSYKNSGGYITLSSTTGTDWFTHINSINLTGYKTLYYEFEYAQKNGNTGNFQFILNSTRFTSSSPTPENTNVVTRKTYGTNVARKVDSIDISNINSYIYMNPFIWVGTLKVYKIWLEK